MKNDISKYSIDLITEVVFDCLKKWELECACIHGSALLTKVMRQLGYPDAYLLTVNVEINNGSMQRWIDNCENSDEDTNFSMCKDPHAFQIRIGKGQFSDDRWPGHLVVVVPNTSDSGCTIIDLTILQANHPERNINILNPILFRVGGSFVSGDTIFEFDFCESRFRYQAFPEDHSYNVRHDCMKLDGIDDATSHVVNILLKMNGEDDF